MKRWVVTLFSLWALTTHAHSAALTVGELLSACDSKNKEQKNFCYGFIISATNAAQFYRNMVDAQDEFVDICFPETIANKDVVDLFVTWAKKNPTLHGIAAFVGTTTSFSTKYSCAEKQEKITLQKK